MKSGSIVALAVSPFALAACGSTHHAAESRGWIGGEFADVSRTYDSSLLSPHHDDIVGMPAGTAGGYGALVTNAYPSTPLARAGVAAGDLLLSVDGVSVDDALGLRERFETMTPGTHVPVSFWRDGETRTTDVVVGRETYRRSGSVTIGLRLSPVLDLWPFNDGIDVFGLVCLRWDEDRNDVTGVVPGYLGKVRPGESIDGPLQESTEGFLLLVGAANGKVVVSQETLP